MNTLRSNWIYDLRVVHYGKSGRLGVCTSKCDFTLTQSGVDDNAKLDGPSLVTFAAGAHGESIHNIVGGVGTPISGTLVAKDTVTGFESAVEFVIEDHADDGTGSGKPAPKLDYVAELARLDAVAGSDADAQTKKEAAGDAEGLRAEIAESDGSDTVTRISLQLVPRPEVV